MLPQRRSVRPPRLALVAVLALLEVAAAALMLSYDLPIGTYGFLVGTDGVTIAAVEPASPAARAGILPGDRLIYATLPLRGRRAAAFQEEVPGNAPISFQVVRDGRPRSVALRAQSAPTAGRIETLTYACAGLAVGLVGLLLVLLRPSAMTWAFAFIAPAMLIPWGALFWSQQTASAAGSAVDVVIALLYAAQTAAIMVFASRFPNDQPNGISRVIDRLSLPVGLAVAAVYLYVYLQLRFASLPPARWILVADYAIVLPGLAALVALLSTYVRTPGSARARLVPVIAGFVLLIVAGILQQLSPQWTANAAVLISLNIVFSASPALVAAAVAYGVIRHRVMDVSFIISRTLVYTILTVAAVSVFSLIEYVFGKLLEHRGVATLLVIAAAVGLGLSLNVLHRRLDEFVDRVLFRRRHLAEKRLVGTARALPHATTDEAVDAALVDEPADAFDLASAAVFRWDDHNYRRIRSRGWSDVEANVLEHDDSLALRLGAELTPIDPHELRWERDDVPAGERQVLYAVPIVNGYRLDAIALYGGHVTGEDLDPDERRSLRRLGIRRSKCLRSHCDREATPASRKRRSRERSTAQRRAEAYRASRPPAAVGSMDLSNRATISGSSAAAVPCSTQLTRSLIAVRSGFISATNARPLYCVAKAAAG